MENCTNWRRVALCVATCTALCYSREDTTITITSDCNTDVILPCPALSYSKQYTSITWYKIVTENTEDGIIRNSSKKGKPELYINYINHTEVSLTEENSLVLKKVNFEHAGMYKCYLAGKVGHRNYHSFVFLNVSEGVTKTTPTLVVTTKFAPHSTLINSSVLGLVQPVEVSALSALVGFFSLSLSKVMLCFVCVWGMVVFKRRQRRKLWITQ